MHSYSSTEAKACLAGKQVAFIGDSRIWHLFISFIRILTATNYTPAWRHVDINYKISDSTAQVNFLWNPKPNADMTKRLASLTQAPVKPDAIIIGVAAWVIEGTKGSAEGLRQYKDKLTSMAGALERLAQDGDVYWHIQEPVRWSALKPFQKNITNKQIDLYNEAATGALNIGSSRIKAFEVSRRAGLESMAEIADGLHMAPRVRDLVSKILSLTTSLCRVCVSHEKLN
uniref:Uncharacterized protein n=1 Tax=Neogobius melanostomus TaxID=47308 RepID=A0A8C6U389_9GOBI